MKQMIGLVDLRAQYRTIQREVRSEIDGVLERMQLFIGENVFLFEEEFAQHCNVRYAVGVGSGTDALTLALRASDVQPGDEVITVPHTFFATVGAIKLANATPVFVDIDPETYTMEPAQIEAAITWRTTAIVPVHLYGHPANMNAILAIARKHKLRVIEDACQAHGAEFKGRKVGTIGDAAAMSFYYSKNLGAYGEGGIVVTNDRSIATKVQMLRNHGQRHKFEHVIVGTNSRLDELQAAVLRVKLRHLDEWNTMRRAHATEYGRLLDGVPDLTLPVERPDAKHVYHLYVVRSPKRDDLQRWLKRRRIATGVHYPIPAHLQEACQSPRFPQGSLPVSEASAREVLSLPMYPELTVDQIGYVAQTLRDRLERPLKKVRSGGNRKLPATNPAR